MSFAERARTEAGLSLSPIAATLWDQYGDERKLANAKRLAAQRERCAIKISAFPWRLIMESHAGRGNGCGQNGATDGALPYGELMPEHVDRFLAELWPFLVQINLSNRGEALLNRQLPEIVARIHRRGVGTCVQSNLNQLPEEICRGALDAGLDMIVASIDGASQEACARYGRDGTLAGALENLAKLVRLRNANPDSHLRIVWRAMCYSHNNQEVQRNRELARAIGVDDFVVVDRDLHRQCPTTEDRASEASEELLCTNAWEFPAIHFDGTLMPCGLAEGARFAWGDLKTQSWMEAYNTLEFQQARHLAAGDSTAVSPCLDCWKMRPMRERLGRGVPLQVVQLAR